MTPKIRNSAMRTLSIPDLAGGVNYRDGISQVLDNQLTDCNNVWFKNGLLRTRPAFRCADSIDDAYISTDFIPRTDSEARRVYAKKENFRIIDGKTYFLVCIQYGDRLVFRYYADESDFIEIGMTDEIPKKDFTCNIFKYNADIYCFCSGYYNDEDIPYYMFIIRDSTDPDSSVPFFIERIEDLDSRGYVPTIFINGLPSAENETGNMVEGYNLLNNRAKYFFSSTTNNAGRVVYMNFTLPIAPKRGSIVKATLTSLSTNKTVTHTVLVGADGYGKEMNPPTTFGEAFATEDKICLYVSDKQLSFRVMGGDVKDPNVWEPISYSESYEYYLPNNVEVEIEYYLTDDERKERFEKVLNMTFNEWFGGGAEGIYGGIHLFMGGNTDEANQSLVIWSDFNKPLYFSENGYAYVGDKSQKTTAFGKQGEQLIIFKERETYATQYVSNNEVIDAEAAINQAVVDVTSAEVTFPMIQVHGFIGCDCPKSVQLCRNRLVWAHSDGKVYTLTSPSQWTERSIFEVSSMVERKLRTHSAEALRKSISADFEGHYMLLVDSTFYVMDYNSYGYTHVYSYSKDEDAQTRIPWWIWQVPSYNRATYDGSNNAVTTREEATEVLNMVCIGEKLYVAGLFYADDKLGGSACMVEWLEADVDKDTDQMPHLVIEASNESKFREVDAVDINAMAQTKLFDFGAPTIRKTVPKVDVSLGANGGVPIMVTTITDHGENSREVVIDIEEADERNPRFFDSLAVRNGEKLVGRFGLRFAVVGKMFLDAMTVYYKMLGGN